MGGASPEKGIPFSSLQGCKTAREHIVNKGYLKDVAIACVDNLAFITILTDEKRLSHENGLGDTGKAINLKT